MDASRTSGRGMVIKKVISDEQLTIRNEEK